MSQRDYELPPEMGLFIQSVREFISFEFMPTLAFHYLLSFGSFN